MAAVMSGNVELVALLLERGADANARTPWGAGARSYRSRDPDANARIQALLKEAGATDPDIWSKVALGILCVGATGMAFVLVRHKRVQRRKIEK